MNGPNFLATSLNILAIGTETADWLTTLAYLREEGHQVTAVTTELHGRFHFQSNPPDLILLGQLPERDTLLAFLRASTQDSDLLILALASPDEVNELLEQFDEVIETPVTRTKVRRRLQTAVRLREANERYHATECSWLDTLANLQEYEQSLRQQWQLSQALQKTHTLAEVVDVCLTAVLDLTQMETAVLHLTQSGTINPKTQTYRQTRPAAAQPPPTQAWPTPNTPLPDASAAVNQIEIPLRHHETPIGHINLNSARAVVLPRQITTILEAVSQQISHALIQVETEEKLNQFYRIVEQSPVSIVITDLDGHIEYVNPKFTAITGYTLAEAIGRKPSILKSGYTSQETYQLLWQTVLAGQEWRGEFLNVKKGGSYFWESALITSLKNRHGQITQLLGIKEDITTRKKLQLELEQHYQELRTLNQAIQVITASLDLNTVLDTILAQLTAMLPSSSCAIWLRDQETGQLTCQRAAGSLKPYLPPQWLDAASEAPPQVAKESLVIDDLLLNNYDDPVAQAEQAQPRSLTIIPIILEQQTLGALQLLDERANHFDPHTITMIEAIAATSATAIENARLHETLQTQYENLKQARLRALQSEKLAILGEIIAGVAHELNNPLAAVVLYSQILLRKHAPVELQEDLQKIITQAKRASKIVRGLLEFSRQRPPERKETSINDLVLQSLQLLAYDLRTHNVTVFTQLSPDIPLIWADSHQLQQLIINLINNAAQAIVETKQNGYLTITTKVKAASQEDDAPGAPVVRLTFQDNGPGIPESIQSRIFEPFFTTKAEGLGTGLGLSLCQKIVTEHGGKIWFESQPGQGATFFVELPIIAAENTAVTTSTAQPDSELSHANNKNRILIVDDEPNLVQVIARVLLRQNYRVEMAFSGQEALEKVKQQAFNLILCDLRMPDTNGFQLYESLLEQSPDAKQKIIFMTGDIVNRNTLHFLQEHNLRYLTKPFEVEDLLHLVATTVSRQPAS